MAPVSAAERQRKRREKLKATGRYDEYKARNASYSKQFRVKKKSDLENLKDEERLVKMDEERMLEKLRKRKFRQKKRADIKSPKKGPGYSSVQGLTRAANRIKKVFTKKSS